MDKHDLHMLGQYVVLAAVIGSYGAMVGSWAVRAVGGAIGTVAVWFGARAGVRAYMDADSRGWEPLNYSTIHFVGIFLSTLGVVGLIQYQIGVTPQSLGGTLVVIGASCVSAGLYERYKREVTHS